MRNHLDTISAEIDRHIKKDMSGGKIMHKVYIIPDRITTNCRYPDNRKKISISKGNRYLLISTILDSLFIYDIKG